MKTNKISKPLLIIVGALIALCIICITAAAIYNATPAGKASLTEVAAEKQTQTAQPTKTTAPTETPVPTNTTGPTDTPAPTNTTAPTNTPVPTNTPTPAPDPIILTGTGDSVVDLSKWDGAALLKIRYTGGGNFSIFNYSADGEKIDLLVNTIGSYHGTLLIDITENTTRFEVTASGPWEINVYPFTKDYVRAEAIPSTITGEGDDVIVLTTSIPDLLKADATGRGNFAVWGYTASGRDLLINEIAPYQGTVVLDRKTFMITIHAEGPWTLEITTKP